MMHSNFLSICVLARAWSSVFLSVLVKQVSVCLCVHTVCGRERPARKQSQSLALTHDKKSWSCSKLEPIVSVLQRASNSRQHCSTCHRTIERQNSLGWKGP